MLREDNRAIFRAASQTTEATDFILAFQPDWNLHHNAAPFKRNDQMLEALPIGVIVFPGSGISENLVGKARKMGIPVWRFTGDGGA